MICSGAAALSLLTGCGPEKNLDRLAETRFVGDTIPVQESWNITLGIDDNGKSRLLLKAGHLSEFRDEDSTTRHLDGGITAVLFGENANSSTTLSAQRGIIHDNGDLEAFDDVVITTADSTTLRTSYIKRTAATATLWTDRFVTIEQQAETIRGYGLQSDDRLSNYTILDASGEAELQP